MAVEYLYKIYPAQAFIVNWGNVPGYDIESADGTIIAECFAATSYKSNGKLAADLKLSISMNSSMTKILRRIIRSITKKVSGYRNS